MSEFDKEKKNLRRKLYSVVKNYCYECMGETHRKGFHNHQVDDLEKIILKHYIPLSTLKQVIEGMKSGQKIDNGHDCYNPRCDYCYNNIRDEALSDVLTAITKLQEGK